jgi:membrane fusion protein (multidrug efflux system)
MMNRREESKISGLVLHFSVAICTCLTLTLPSACKKSKPAAPPPPVVEVADVIQKDVPVIHEWVGTTDGLVNATIRAQVAGYLIRQDYREGDQVKKGQVLFEIDPRPFQAALDQAQGTLAQMEAQYANAKANLDRIRPLAEENAVSKKDLDDAIGAEQSALAAATASKAAVEKARLDLGFTKVTSLIGGVAGLSKAQVGDLVGPAQTTELTTVSTIDPIKVYYTINEQTYINFIKPFASGPEALKEARKLVIELYLADGSLYQYKGKWYAIDRSVNPRTGTLKAEVLFPNPGNLLRPGQFVTVHVLIGTKKGALLIPQRAVTELQGNYLVAVVNPDSTVNIKPVKVGQQVGSLLVIDEGLKPGERVIAEGTMKVREGMHVNPKPYGPGPEGAPASTVPETKPTPTTQALPR